MDSGSTQDTRSSIAIFSSNVESVSKAFLQLHKSYRCCIDAGDWNRISTANDRTLLICIGDGNVSER